jgi:hypothetical protein
MSNLNSAVRAELRRQGDIVASEITRPTPIDEHATNISAYLL